ncbi:hypothetical protein PCANC_26534 [Puccinia coronata f. sp. avenae]|uniref:Uncharacterized protein n=1 Tax=Puccinia coronata f. sp. avenae TaxID=200324 RepID=A0A2N5S595_9BASI|nr:hypothetical protein PCASD_23238 [Puccinia coronata f. sp. avenae]PLW30823.1 hypothetical protein PCANC_26534 [Puccinia coronata f. sp. avenae]PLW39794.1 hypothetical protein PCASD_10729 [Puccinia coronata f. sp. avenae]
MHSPATAALNQIMTTHQRTAEQQHPLENNTRTTTEQQQQQQQQQQQNTHRKKKKNSHQNHHKGRYSLSLFSQQQQNKNNNNSMNCSPFSIPSANTSTPTLLSGQPSSPGYASLSAAAQSPTAGHEAGATSRAARHQSLTTAMPAGFLARYLSPSTNTSTTANSHQYSPVPGPSARRDDYHPSCASASTTTISPVAAASSSSQPSQRALARSYTLAPESLASASAVAALNSSHSSLRFAPPPNNNNNNNNNNISQQPSLRTTPLLPSPRTTLDNRSKQGPASSAQDRPNNPASTPASQLEAKVVILGMQGVGKTSIVHRYTTGSFSYSLTSTIGASFCTKKLSVDGCKVRLQIWDTAGQERFRSMAPMYYRGANAAILVYDITNMESFLDIQNWLDELRQNMSGDLIIQVVGSKADLAADRRAVDLDDAQGRLAAWTAGAVRPEDGQLVLTTTAAATVATAAVVDDSSSSGTGVGWTHVGISEVSAKDDFGIEELFLILSRRLVLRKAQIDALRMQRSRDSVRVDHAHLPPDHPDYIPPLAPGSSAPAAPHAGFCC